MVHSSTYHCDEEEAAKDYYKMGVKTGREICGMCVDTIILEQQRKQQQQQQRKQQRHQRQRQQNSKKDSHENTLSPRSYAASRSMSPTLMDEYLAAAEAVVDAVFPCSALAKNPCAPIMNKKAETETTTTEVSMTMKPAGGAKGDYELTILDDCSRNKDLTPEQAAEVHNHDKANITCNQVSADEEGDEGEEDEPQAELTSFSSSSVLEQEQNEKLEQGDDHEAVSVSTTKYKVDKEPLTMILLSPTPRKNSESYSQKSNNSSNASTKKCTGSKTPTGLMDNAISLLSSSQSGLLAKSASLLNNFSSKDYHDDHNNIEKKLSKEISAEEHLSSLKKVNDDDDGNKDESSTAPSIQQMPSSLPPLKLISKREETTKAKDTGATTSNQNAEEDDDDLEEEDDMTGPRPARSGSPVLTLVNGTNNNVDESLAASTLTQEDATTYMDSIILHTAKTTSDIDASADVDVDVGLNDYHLPSVIKKWPHPVLPRTTRNELYVVREQLQWTQTQLDATQYEVSILRGMKDVYQRELETKAMECRLAQWRLLHEHEVQQTVQNAAKAKKKQQQQQQQQQHQKKSKSSVAAAAKFKKTTGGSTSSSLKTHLVQVVLLAALVIGMTWLLFFSELAVVKKSLSLASVNLNNARMQQISFGQWHQSTLEHAMDLTLEASIWERKAVEQIQEVFSVVIDHWRTLTSIDGSGLSMDVHDNLIHSVLLVSTPTRLRLPQWQCFDMSAIKGAFALAVEAIVKQYHEALAVIGDMTASL